MEGDYLPPWGHGKIADMIVSIAPREEWEVYSARLQPTLILTFPGEGNGICEVPLNRDGGPLVFAAPETGYSREFGPVSYSACYANSRVESINGKNRRTFPAYCFRIRSEFDADGRLVAGHYGKIYGDIYPNFVWPPSPPLVKLPAFSCYVNPVPLDTNLEPLPPYPDRRHGP